MLGARCPNDVDDIRQAVMGKTPRIALSGYKKMLCAAPTVVTYSGMRFASLGDFLPSKRAVMGKSPMFQTPEP